MSDNQYDKFSGDYEKWLDTPLKKFAFVETIKRNLPDLKGKRVLDIACGTGLSMEILYELGADEVVGVDISSAAIEIAKTKFPDAKFIVKDLSKEKIEEESGFDVVTAFFIIEYMDTKEKLDYLISNIYSTLNTGGVFYSLTLDEHATADKEEYGILGDEIVAPGEGYINSLYSDDGQKLFDVQMYYWPEDTIKSALDVAGFSNYKKLPPFVSDEGINEKGKEYWNNYLNNCPYLLFSVEKIGSNNYIKPHLQFNGRL